MNTAGQRLRHAREWVGLTQAEVAKLAGIPADAVARIERPSATTRVMLDVSKVAQALGLSLDDVCTTGVSSLDVRQALHERILANERTLAEIEARVAALDDSES